MEEDFIHEMSYDDEALLRFAFLWLRFSLFGEPTMRARPEAIEAIKGRAEERRAARCRPMHPAARMSAR